MFEYRTGESLPGPQFLCQVRRKRRHHQRESAEGFLHRGLRYGGFVRMQFVQQFHQGGNRSIEMPPGFKVFRDLLQRLMQFALDRVVRGACSRRNGISRREPVDAAEEPGNPLDSRFGPIRFLLRWPGKQNEHA